ncbi:MAG: cofactor-independent phosphoglycerate mutase [Lentisphaerae bacterium]|nr:cofactor-independent phosphoglycerate mutase [Lentisphaerota bacterium]
MNRVPTVIFVGDGMADEAVAELGGNTPLQHARTPAMDSIARDGRSGTLLTLPDGFATSSEVANMSILGCDLATEYCGRGPLEAAGRNIPLGPEDTAFRLNLVTVENGILRDFSGGHIAQEDAEGLIAELGRRFGTDKIRFHPGVSYRNILVLSGAEFSHELKTDKPDDNHGEPVADHLPSPLNAGAEDTATLLRTLIDEAPAVLEQHPVNRRLVSEGRAMANGIWPWNGGKAGALRTVGDKYGITGAVISAVDVIVGLGRCLGMDVLTVPGATGYIDTNYEGKADAAIEALKDHDLVFAHVEGIDEVSHARDLEKKIAAIEDFDSRLVARVLNAAGPAVNVAVLPDHPVPIALGKHTRVPVPVAVRMIGNEADNVQTFDEVASLTGSLGAMANGDLMALLFG